MLRITKHAQEAMDVRQIAIDWIEAALTAPDRSEPDPGDPTLTRSFKTIVELGGRILRVVHRPEGDDIVIVTVHLDRGAPR